MPKYPFLSDEWVAEATKIREAAGETATETAHVVKMNLIVTDVPFDNPTVEAHMDSSSGSMDMGLGFLDDPELTVTLDYETAKQILVEGNAQAGMQAFMAGKIKVQGDMTKLMAMQQSTPDPVAAEVTAKIQEITE